MQKHEKKNLSYELQPASSIIDLQRPAGYKSQSQLLEHLQLP